MDRSSLLQPNFMPLQGLRNIQYKWSLRPLFSLWAVLVVAGAIMLSVATVATASMFEQYRSLAISAQPVGIKTVASPKSTASQPAAVSSAVSTPVPSPAQLPKTPVAAAIPACTPGSRNAPSPLDITNAANGVSQQIDNPTQYQIYGNNMNDLRQQIQRCSPAGGSSGGPAEYTAQNNYNLSWRYNYRSVGSSCTITDVKVGLHVTMDMPLWQPTSSAQAGLPAAWAAFVANLKTHEDGHTTISQQQAQAMLGDIQNIGTTDCASLGQMVQQTADKRMAILNQAQEAYDAQTNHGASQGAVVPR